MLQMHQKEATKSTYFNCLSFQSKLGTLLANADLILFLSNHHDRT